MKADEIKQASREGKSAKEIEAMLVAGGGWTEAAAREYVAAVLLSVTVSEEAVALVRTALAKAGEEDQLAATALSPPELSNATALLLGEIAVRLARLAEQLADLETALDR